jgi:hypothetical protein
MDYEESIASFRESFRLLPKNKNELLSSSRNYAVYVV